MLRLKTIFLTAFFLLFLHAINYCRAQTNSNRLQPYIAALFTHNADTVQKWYVTNFDFAIMDHKYIEEQKLNFYLLEKDNFLLEIIQRPDALNTQHIKDTMKTYKYLTGFFKTGFYVENIRMWYNRLNLAGVKIQSENVSNGQTGHYISCVDPEGNLVQLFERENLEKVSSTAEADIEIIKNAIQRTAKAINEKNADSIMVHYSKDILVSYPGIADTRYDEFYESYKRMLTPQPGINVSTVPVIQEIIVSGELAVVRMIWETTIAETTVQKNTIRQAKDLQIWKRENGTWKFIRGMWYHIKQ